MAADDRSRSEAARRRRQEQLQRWLGSEMDRTEVERPCSGRRSRVRFAQGAVFMAACSAGDRAEVSELLREGTDINQANVDGLTALHQACIDENAEMVQFLVENGSDVNRGDNEGWTPLHAAASCGFLQIAKYLIEHGALVGLVNSEGELPVDVATDDAMENLLNKEIKDQGVDTESARREEEKVMLQDAKVMAAGRGVLIAHHITGATALHVAAAKGYVEVLKLLLQCGLDVNVRDNEGWTPLHAAAHWGQEESSTLLAESLCDMETVNHVGQSPLDVADENLVEHLEELQKKQNALRSEKQKSPIIETSPPLGVVPTRQRRTSISRMSSKDKINLHERERLQTPPLQNAPPEEEEEENLAAPQGSSSSSSEEESESESDMESEKAKTREIINNKRNSSALPATTTPAAMSGNVVKKATEVPGSWRNSLRNATSSLALGGSGTEPGEKSRLSSTELTSGMTRSASSPKLSSETDTKEPRLARVPPTPTRRLFSITDNFPDTSNSLTRSSSYTRRLNSQSGSELTRPDTSLPRSSSYGKKHDESAVTSVTAGNTSCGLSRLSSLLANRITVEQADKAVTPVSTSTAVSTAAVEQENKQRRRSYLTPVRDEEAEALRKARSRHARQSRRSTQGVTLTDLQEAEKTIKTEEKEKRKEEEEKDVKQKKGEEGEISWRSRIANLQKSDLLGLTSPAGVPRSHSAEIRETEDAGDAEEWMNRERRARARRRVTQRTGESDENEPCGEEEPASGRGVELQSKAEKLSSRSEVLLNNRILSRTSDEKDYKKMFDDISQENRRLQSQLQDTQRSVSQTRADLDKATQRQERFSDCCAMLDMEKKERRMLERRVTELEEELKVLGDLRADNQRLKDENGALIRVISKLSK